MRLAAALAACALGGACVSAGKLEQSAPGITRTSPQAAFAAAEAAHAKVHPGDTRDQVAAALGPSNIVQFESGWQVWVYRWPGADESTRAATELVILFEPAGTVRKSRVRRGEAPTP